MSELASVASPSLVDSVELVVPEQAVNRKAPIAKSATSFPLKPFFNDGFIFSLPTSIM
jgi:hypothetical protein